jgi:hypothetical protein
MADANVIITHVRSYVQRNGVSASMVMTWHENNEYENATGRQYVNKRVL